MPFPRRSGILLHPTSLPSPHGIGDWGQAAYDFVDFLCHAKQTYWQMLPLSPTGYGDSPYQATSAFAGNPLLISLDRLVEQQFLQSEQLAAAPDFPADQIDFAATTAFKGELLTQAYATFKAAGTTAQTTTFNAFCAREAAWLDDYALFAALKAEFELRPWYEWERPLASRNSSTLEKWQLALADTIAQHKFWQWLFFDQLADLKAYANERGVQLIGDIPIFIARDSADVWANTDLFLLDDELEPTVVSGVPPDFFSETGQLWGHPHYRWDEMEKRGYGWWISRFRMLQQQADVIRIDHFRGFYDYWEVPADATTAMGGVWRKGPGAPLFRAVVAELGELQLIAEDLGDFEAASRAGVDALQREFGFPGMKLLVAAFDGREPQFLPHNISAESVVYTGTHDNPTVVGWFEEASEAERDYVRRYLDVTGEDIAWDLIRRAWSTTACIAITPAQDLLSLDNRARMNTPSTTGAPNWLWRLSADALDANIAQRLADLTLLYERADH